jgi:hypothetical protein
MLPLAELVLVASASASAISKVVGVVGTALTVSAMAMFAVDAPLILPVAMPTTPPETVEVTAPVPLLSWVLPTLCRSDVATRTVVPLMVALLAAAFAVA